MSKENERDDNYKVSRLQLLPFKLLVHQERKKATALATIFHLRFMCQMTELCQAPELSGGGSSGSSAFQIQKQLASTK